MLTHVLPYPLDAGPKVRAYYTIRHLGREHDVTLVSFVRGDEPQSAVDHLKCFCSSVKSVLIKRSRGRDCWYLLRSLVTGEPFLICRDWYPAMAAAVRQVVSEGRQIDAIHADQLAMAPYALMARRQVAARVVLDQHNAVFRVPDRLAEFERNPVKRWMLRRESRKLANYEGFLCSKFDYVVWVAKEDAAALQTVCKSTDVFRNARVIPISIEASTGPRVRRQKSAHRIVFVGGLHWPPNVDAVSWFSSRVWPIVRAALPNAVLTIVGCNPGNIARPDATNNIDVVGHVSDLSSYFEECAVFVVPLRAGGGMRVKILDAWAWGVPVVSTRVGAEGIAAVHGKNVLLADDESAFAEAVIRVASDPRLATDLVAGGHLTLQSNYEWRSAYTAWNEIYQCASSSSFRMHRV